MNKTIKPGDAVFHVDGGKGVVWSVDYDTGICEVAWVELTKPPKLNIDQLIKIDKMFHFKGQYGLSEIYDIIYELNDEIDDTAFHFELTLFSFTIYYGLVHIMFNDKRVLCENDWEDWQPDKVSLKDYLRQWLLDHQTKWTKLQIKC